MASVQDETRIDEHSFEQRALQDESAPAGDLSEVVSESQDSRNAPPPNPPQLSLFMTIMKTVVLYIVFSMVSKRILSTRISKQRVAMDAVEDDLIVQNLGPIPENEIDVHRLKEIFGIQSKKIPQFPEFDAMGRPITLQRCLFKPHQFMDLYVYSVQSNSTVSSGLDEKDLLWEERGLTFDWEPTNNRDKKITLPVFPQLYNNESAFVNIYLTKSGASPNPRSKSYRRNDVTKIVHQLNTYRPLPKTRVSRNLLEKNATKVTAIEDIQPIIANFWKPTLNIQLVDMTSDFIRNHIPHQFAEYIQFDERTGNYFPIIYVNEFWLQSKHYVQINDTVQNLTLDMSYGPIGLTKWQVMSQMEQQWKSQQKLGLQDEKDADTMIDMLGDTSPWLLGLTFIVSCFHSLFDFLAFKNDISFWRSNKSLEGLSVRSMLIGCFFQTIITLYLFDNNTSYMILISSAIGLLIEYWKLKKAFTGKMEWIEGRTFPKITFSAVKTYSESDTKKYDKIATQHLSFLVFPLVVGYAMYSLIYKEHKGWYSWILSSLSGFVYMFGFINMTPQLFINYKLKSVAHLPWRAMVYKSLNTFIDDLFSFIVKMPVMHRLACFRDDIIFVFYIYQRWAYRTDYSRVNEYGQVAKPLLENQTVQISSENDNKQHDD